MFIHSTQQVSEHQARDVTRVRTCRAVDSVGHACLHKTLSTLPNELKPYALRFSLKQRVVLNDRFELIKLLGSGGMSEVYQARDLHKQQYPHRYPIAIKLLSEQWQSDQYAKAQLIKEAEILSRLTHSGIVRMIEVDSALGSPIITMEFVKGDTLEAIIKHYTLQLLPVDDALSLIKKLAMALAHTHEQRLVHADIKPGNVIVTATGGVKIIDFGAAQRVDPSNESALGNGYENQNKMDYADAYTPAYASAETIAGASVDVRDDVYALGCIAYELLSGRHPYQRMPADEAIRAGMVAQKIDRIRPKQWRAIYQAIVLKRQQRTPCMSHFYNELAA